MRSCIWRATRYSRWLATSSGEYMSRSGWPFVTACPVKLTKLFDPALYLGLDAPHARFVGNDVSHRPHRTAYLLPHRARGLHSGNEEALGSHSDGRVPFDGAP